MKTYLNLSEDYHAYGALFNILKKLKIVNVIISDSTDTEHLVALRGRLELEMVKPGNLYNIIRDDVDLCVICTNGEDKQSIYVTKYCVNHRMPVLLLTNMVDAEAYLEVV